jgi:hypothetical protein
LNGNRERPFAGVVGFHIQHIQMETADDQIEDRIRRTDRRGQHYPNSNYLTGGYGVRATPRPGYYYRRDFYGPGPAGLAPVIVGGPIGTAAIVVVPVDAYAYYGGPAYGGPAYYPDY